MNFVLNEIHGMVYKVRIQYPRALPEGMVKWCEDTYGVNAYGFWTNYKDCIYIKTADDLTMFM